MNVNDTAKGWLETVEKAARDFPLENVVSARHEDAKAGKIIFTCTLTFDSRTFVQPEAAAPPDASPEG